MQAPKAKAAAKPVAKAAAAAEEESSEEDSDDEEEEEKPAAKVTKHSPLGPFLQSVLLTLVSTKHTLHIAEAHQPCQWYCLPK